MVFDPPIIPFLTEMHKMFSSADEMDFEIYDSSLNIEEIAGKLRNLENTNFGVITDVGCIPTSSKTDAIVWRMTVRLELFSTYKGRKQVADMIAKAGSVATQYAEVFEQNLNHTGFGLIRMGITDTVIGSSNFDGAITWQNGYIVLEYYLSQLYE